MLASTRRAELKTKIQDSLRFWLAEGSNPTFAAEATAHLSGPARAVEKGRLAAEKHLTECAHWEAELAALSAPMVGLTAHDGRLFLETEQGVFELKGGKFVYLPLVREEAA